jgi:two-component system, LuxR family, response regulator FixJ
VTDHPIVFVVDDDLSALESLKWMLEQADLHVRTFRSGQDFLDAYRPDETGCLVVDVRMPEMDGLMLQQMLHKREILLPIIFITAHGDVATCASAFREGAVDFMEKPVNDTVLLASIERLMARRSPPGNGAKGCFSDRMHLLTPTEVEVLNALVDGKTIKDIARVRRVSVQTIWRHQMNLFPKIGVQSQVELVRLATQWQFQHAQ